MRCRPCPGPCSKGITGFADCGTAWICKGVTELIIPKRGLGWRFFKERGPGGRPSVLKVLAMGEASTVREFPPPKRRYPTFYQPKVDGRSNIGVLKSARSGESKSSAGSANMFRILGILGTQSLFTDPVVISMLATEQLEELWRRPGCRGQQADITDMEAVPIDYLKGILNVQIRGHASSRRFSRSAS